MKSATEIPRVLKCCPNLKKLTLASDFSGDFPCDEFSLTKLEEVELTVQVTFGGESLLSNIHKTLKLFPTIEKLSINSQLEGKLDCDSVNLQNLTFLKIDFN